MEAQKMRGSPHRPGGVRLPEACPILCASVELFPEFHPNVLKLARVKRESEVLPISGEKLDVGGIVPMRRRNEVLTVIDNHHIPHHEAVRDMQSLQGIRLSRWWCIGSRWQCGG